MNNTIEVESFDDLMSSDKKMNLVWVVIGFVIGMNLIAIVMF